MFAVHIVVCLPYTLLCACRTRCCVLAVHIVVHPTGTVVDISIQEGGKEEEEEDREVAAVV